MIFSLERAAVVWAIPERISDFDPSLEMIAPRYLKFSTSSSLWPFILISLWKPFGLFVITFVLPGLIFILYLVVVLSRRSALPYAKVVGRPPRHWKLPSTIAWHENGYSSLNKIIVISCRNSVFNCQFHPFLHVSSFYLSFCVLKMKSRTS